MWRLPIEEKSCEFVTEEKFLIPWKIYDSIYEKSELGY